MATTTDLSVRQHERHSCDAPVRVYVAQAHAEAVKLASIGADGPATRIVDYSNGGLGLRSSVYLPLTCMLRLRVGMAAGGHLEVDVKVQRVVMSDRKPTFYVGTAFETGTPEHQKTVAAVLAALRESSPPAPKEGPRA
ncbi:MAG: PilZ domain-containing protein [Phycisphaerales bacterium]